MNVQPHIKRTLLHAILFAAAILLSALTHAQVQVAFSGHVTGPGEGRAITITLVNGGDTTTMDIPRNGAFSVFTQVNNGATLTVSSPGFISKQIVFNTAATGNGLSARTEQVRFNVALEARPEGGQLAYAGPVGMIDLTGARGGGRPALVALAQQWPGTDRSAIIASR